MLLLPQAANAGDNNAAVTACKDKAEGAACAVMKPSQDENGTLVHNETPGSCVASECCDLDYSKGSPPQTVCGPCLACEGPAPAAEAGADGSAGQDVAGEPPRATRGQEPPASPGNEKRGCSVGARSTEPTALGLGGLLLIAFAGIRRR